MDSDTLVDLLRNVGVDIRKSDGREITGRCPVHARVTGHEDHSPSWSMNAASGLWICFSCGARGTLGTLVKELTGSDDAVSSVRELTFKAVSDRAYGNGAVKSSQPDVDWMTFSRFSKVPEAALESRSLNSDLTYQYGIRWDTTNKCWVIPIVSPVGELMGWQSKKKGWVRNYPEGVKKSETMFGIDQFKSKTAVLVESPLDVVRFAEVFESPQALSSFGAAVSATQLEILDMVAERIIIAMDNDDAGRAATKSIYRSVKGFGKAVRFFYYGKSSAKDIGDMTDREIMRGISKSTTIPPWLIP